MRALLAVLLLGVGPAIGAPVTYALPEETAALKEGPGMENAAACGACHSTDYISTQPRGLGNPRAFWQAEVVKMKAAYGAPIEDADVGKIVDYLVAAYGK